MTRNLKNSIFSGLVKDKIIKRKKKEKANTLIFFCLKIRTEVVGGNREKHVGKIVTNIIIKRVTKFLL